MIHGDFKFFTVFSSMNERWESKIKQKCFGKFINRSCIPLSLPIAHSFPFLLSPSLQRPLFSSLFFLPSHHLPLLIFSLVSFLPLFLLLLHPLPLLFSSLVLLSSYLHPSFLSLSSPLHCSVFDVINL